MSDTVKAPPVELGSRGRALWGDLWGTYEFDPHETEMVMETCRTLDVIDKLTESIEVDGVMITGSQGQKVLNAAVAELRQQQAAFARLVGQLNLLDAELGSAMSARSSGARAAAQARWREKKERARA